MTVTNPSDSAAIIIYEPPEGGPRVDVRLDRDNVWLNAHQMGELFGRDRTVVLRHIRNIYATGELPSDSTCAKYAQVAADGRLRQMDFYNLDVILSVGYRVNSRRGTQFRIWATNVLRDHLIRGYSVDERRLRELRLSLELVQHTLEAVPVDADEAAALLRLITEYAYGLDLLDDYDHQRVNPLSTAAAPAVPITYEEALGIIEQLRVRFGAPPYFGREKDESLHSSLNAIMQTFDGADVYPGLELKAAHLLYFLVKNHSFVDGNKRIGAALFLWFMEKNGLLRGATGALRIANNALVALTLLVAVSQPAEKPVIISMTVNLINARN